MKLKNLFDIKNIKRFVILAVILFFVLPIIIPQKKAIKIIKKEISTDREESPLPIFKKETPLQKYVKLFKQFYGFDKEPVQVQDEEEEGVSIEEINANDLFFSLDDDDEINQTLFAQASSVEIADTSVNLQKGTVQTDSGLLIEPTQEGYYYQGTFYKNGTYPKDADKQEIERALSNYHSAIARYNGKKALYYADDKGNLTVNYVSEYPDDMDENIDKYFTRNPLVQTGATSVPAQNNMSANATQRYNNQRYDGAHINGNGGNFQNTNADISDIALASLHDMHSAYNLAAAKIKSGELQNINLEQPQSNQNQNNQEFENSLNNLSVSEPSINPNDPNLCQGNTCDDAFIIAPKTKGGSDLSQFYNSFCENDNCPFTEALKDNPTLMETNLNSEKDIQELADKLKESDKTDVEIAYIHPDEKYNTLINQLQQMELKNKNGDPIEFHSRNFETVNIDNENSFGDKLLASRKASIKKDLNTNPNLVNELVEQYNYVYDNVDTLINDNNQTQTTLDMLDLQERPNYPVALVEKDKDGNFIVNSPYLPGGYGSTEIPAWEKYAVTTENGTHYKISKQDLAKIPDNIVVIFVTEDNKKIRFPNEHPVTVITKDRLNDLKFGNVSTNLFSLYSAQVRLAEYNAYKNGVIQRPFWMGERKEQKDNTKTPSSKK